MRRRRTPTPISPNELYSALQTKVVDGQETALTTIEASRYYEVQKYCSLTNHIWSGNWNLINMEKWKSLPPQFQQIVRRRLNEAALLQRHDDTILLGGAIQGHLERQGLAFNTASPASFKAKLVAGGY